jgi:membrane glycosyltransferase
LPAEHRLGTWLARVGRRGHHGAVIGALIMAVILVVVLPVSVLIGTGVIAALLGWTAKTDVDRRYEGTEYIELS